MSNEHIRALQSIQQEMIVCYQDRRCSEQTIVLNPRTESLEIMLRAVGGEDFMLVAPWDSYVSCWREWVGYSFGIPQPPDGGKVLWEIRLKEPKYLLRWMYVSGSPVPSDCRYRVQVPKEARGGSYDGIHYAYRLPRTMVDLAYETIGERGFWGRLS